MARRLLILKGASRQRGPEVLVPAIERYDSPLWQVLRRALAETPSLSNALDVYALSGRFGLIPASTPIAKGHQTMAAERSEALRPEVLDQFGTLMAQPYSALCLGVSRRYLRAMEGWEHFVPAESLVTITDGPMGVKLAQLRAWLEGKTWVPRAVEARLAAPERPRGVTHLAGVPICLSREEVMELARQGLTNDPHGAHRYRDWYVLVDGQPVAPKWLVSRISGLPAHAFDAAGARRVLLALGVSLERVRSADTVL